MAGAGCSRQSPIMGRLRRDLQKGPPTSTQALMDKRKQHGLVCKRARKWKATSNSRHRLPVALNLLD